jgi:hypothetical protein
MPKVVSTLPQYGFLFDSLLLLLFPFGCVLTAYPTLMSVSLSHGNGAIGSVAFSSSSVEIFGFDRSSGPIW